MPLFREITHRWLAHNRKLMDGGIKMPSSVRKYEGIARGLSAFFGDTDVTKIGRIEAREYAAHRAGKGLSAVTINHELTVLRAVLRFAGDLGYLREVPKIKALPVRNEHKDLPDIAEVLRALEGVAEPHQSALRFSMLTGCSWHEVERLIWGDIDWRAGTIAIGQRGNFTTKTAARSRVLPMSKSVRALLRAVSGQTSPGSFDPIFPSATATRLWLWRNRTHTTAFLTPSLMRKVFASTAADNDIPEHTLQRMLGHAPGSAMTRKHYVRVQQQKMKDGMDMIARAL